MRSVDGLSNLQYSLVETIEQKLFTLIRVSYNETLIKSTISHLKRKPLPQLRHQTQSS